MSGGMACGRARAFGAKQQPAVYAVEGTTADSRRFQARLVPRQQMAHLRAMRGAPAAGRRASSPPTATPCRAPLPHRHAQPAVAAAAPPRPAAALPAGAPRGRPARRLFATVSAAAEGAEAASLEGKRVLVIGGTGRVGGSSASALLAKLPGVSVTLAGRSRDSYDAATERRPELKAAGFQALDIGDKAAVKAALSGFDLVIHAAGPFQRSENHNVLEAAIEARTAYLDVSDDVTYSERSRDTYAAAAVAAGVPAVISAGIYPGVSNLMAAHIVSIARKEYNEDWSFRDTPEPGGFEPSWLRYSYYTAGTGGAGPTILATSVLLAGEDVKVYKDGQEFIQPPLSNPRSVDFGPGIGRHGLFLYNLPETVSAFKYMKVGGASARFATAPFFWNWLMWLTARVVPRTLLTNPNFAMSFAKAIGPLVAPIDKIVGEAVAMKVEVELSDGRGTKKDAAGIFVHRRLSESVGVCIAAFAASMLRGHADAGVWYPEERGAARDRRALLQAAADGCERFDLNKPSWALESEINSTVGMIYW